ncbi:FGGY-family carbohydrate kinase [Microbacterium sp. lyk4-40-TSB-66]|uniref:FGGY-family carbohydrate kinase n=1 Tax=Microbacterium sp. lyk4-40-TSB-66 TaxID=3040294 RepID=UPI002549CF17|nr:FGGY-family carbohydrate kinase [Microbacterium sp. lyk4-40-TSB-66]
MPYVVAIDNGSQSTKVLIVDETGRIHASARAALRPYESSSTGQVVHPDDDVWDSIRTACRSAMQRFTADPAEIVGVGLCTIRFCRALMREDGTLAEPMMSWMDARVGRAHTPAADVAKVTTSSGYINHRLTGSFTDAAGNYQGVWPIDQHTWQWSLDDAAYASTGMSKDLLAQLIEPGGLLGRVTDDAAVDTGLPSGVPVFATANDKAVEALGAGLGASDDVLLSLGTYIAAMTPTGGAESGAAHWSNFGARPGQYLAESGGIRRGMWTVSWLRSLLQSETPDAEDPYALDHALGREAAEVAAGCDGIAAVLDWLAPADALHRRGAFVGFSGMQGRGHLHRAILEGIAFTMADHIDAMAAELDRSFRSLIVTGGGARSDVLLQILADVTGLPVRRAAVDDAAGIGAAVCAAVGAGLHPDWASASTAMTATIDAAAPSAERERYAALRPWHRGVRARVAQLSEWSESHRG